MLSGKLTILEKFFLLCCSFVKGGSSFVRGLALGSVQCGAMISSAPLPTLSPQLNPPLPPTKVSDEGVTEQTCVTLSAGKSYTLIFKNTESYCQRWSSVL